MEIVGEYIFTAILPIFSFSPLSSHNKHTSLAGKTFLEIEIWAFTIAGMIGNIKTVYTHN